MLSERIFSFQVLCGLKIFLVRKKIGWFFFPSGISFTPREVGEHLVSVKKKGTLLPGAPFRIHVGENEVGNSNKVKISGAGLEHAQTQQYNEFIVDTRNAGTIIVINCIKINYICFRYLCYFFYEKMLLN